MGRRQHRKTQTECWDDPICTRTMTVLDRVGERPCEYYFVLKKHLSSCHSVDYFQLIAAKFVITGATQEMLRKMPVFKYAEKH